MKPKSDEQLNFNEDEQIRHSDDIQDIISSTPSWLATWGMYGTIVVVLTVLAISYFVEYPDVVKCKLKISSFNAPKSIVTRITGKLSKILVSDGNPVYAGEHLAYLQSTADPETIIRLGKQLKTLSKQSDKLIANKAGILALPSQQVLGEIQTSYEIFYNIYLEFLSSVNNGYYLRKKNLLNIYSRHLRREHDDFLKQEEIQKKDLSLASDELLMHRKLEEAKVETESEYRQQLSKYLAKESPIIQTDQNILNTQATAISKKTEILDLENQISASRLKFRQALNSLISQIDTWEQQYILFSPEEGIIHFMGIIQANQNFIPNQEVMYVNSSSDNFFGQLSIPQENFGKVSVGQKVLIKLRGYPFQEFGYITGNITSISEEPFKDSIYFSNVKIRSSKVYKNAPHFKLKEGMLADAEIITKSETVLHRITTAFLNFKSY